MNGVCSLSICPAKKMVVVFFLFRFIGTAIELPIHVVSLLKGEYILQAVLLLLLQKDYIICKKNNNI